MKITIGELKKILQNSEFSKYFEYRDEEYFTFLNIAVPVGEISGSIDYTNTLYFPVWSKDSEKDGWYNQDFDRRLYLDKVFESNPDWSFIIDETCNDVSTEKWIKVKDVFTAIKEIYNYVLSKKKAKVIAITGSVGKTTTVSMLEHIISKEKKVLRIFSKRITPLILWSYIINFLEKNTEIVVLEMSFYRKFHVEWLSAELNPDISVVLNIDSNHIGVDVKNKDEILD